MPRGLTQEVRRGAAPLAASAFSPRPPSLATRRGPASAAQTPADVPTRSLPPAGPACRGSAQPAHQLREAQLLPARPRPTARRLCPPVCLRAGRVSAPTRAVQGTTPRAVSLQAEGLQGSDLFILDFGYDYTFFTMKANWFHSCLRSGNLDTSLLPWCRMTQCYLPPPDLPCWPPLAYQLNAKKKSLSTRVFFYFKKGKK